MISVPRTGPAIEYNEEYSRKYHKIGKSYHGEIRSIIRFLPFD